MCNSIIHTPHNPPAHFTGNTHWHQHLVRWLENDYDERWPRFAAITHLRASACNIRCWVNEQTTEWFTADWLLITTSGRDVGPLWRWWRYPRGEGRRHRPPLFIAARWRGGGWCHASTQTATFSLERDREVRAPAVTGEARAAPGFKE